MVRDQTFRLTKTLLTPLYERCRTTAHRLPAATNLPLPLLEKAGDTAFAAHAPHSAVSHRVTVISARTVRVHISPTATFSGRPGRHGAASCGAAQDARWKYLNAALRCRLSFCNGRRDRFILPSVALLSTELNVALPEDGHLNEGAEPAGRAHDDKEGIKKAQGGW